MKKNLISSYDEINDIFVGKVDGEHGFCADYGISDGVFMGVDKFHIPNSIYVCNASEVLNISKYILENADVKIAINCDEFYLNFSMCIDDLKILSVKCINDFGIPKLKFLFDSNY